MNIFVFETTPCKNSGYLRAFSLKLFSQCGISWLFWNNNYHENNERKNAIYPYNKVSTSFKVLLQNCSLAHSDGTSGSRSFLSFVKQYLLVRLNYLLITQTLNSGFAWARFNCLDCDCLFMSALSAACIEGESFPSSSLKATKCFAETLKHKSIYVK